MSRALALVVALLAGAAAAQGYQPRTTGLLLSAERVQEVLLGHPMSFDSLYLTQSNPSVDSLTLAGGRLRFWPAGDIANAYMHFDNSIDGLRMVFAVVALGAGASFRVDTITSNTPSTTPVAIEAAAGLKLTPQASVLACVNGLKGQSTVLSSDGRTYYCDGTTSQRVGFSLTNTASVDFADMADGAGDTKTLTVTGAAIGDVAHCSPVSGAPETGLVYSYDRVTAADTVTLARLNKSGGNLNPAAITYTCVVTR